MNLPMTAEFGQFFLLTAFALSIFQVLVPATGLWLRKVWILEFARPIAITHGLFLIASFITLTIAFVSDDFSVSYVAANSNSALPTIYKISAVWGAHEGSLLLWVTFLGMWSMAVAFFSKTLPVNILANVLMVIGLVTVGFLLFTIETSNPFLRELPRVPTDGADLNPLLQDFGLIVHPPTLYMGYVGLSVAFAFAITALMTGQLDAAWARWARPWTNVAWVFLTIGIALGSWWAYYELGWGGWWFWDPVENASLMPWLVATALMHSLAVTEKRGMFKSWTLLLAIFAFSLSLLGAFLVRSGVLTSVHAFASDPERGVFLLVLLAICVGGSLLLYAIRASIFTSSAKYGWLSRESLLLINNLLLVVAALTVLVGTLYPLAYDFFGLGKLSVGAAWFNSLFVPLALLALALVGIGGLARWRSDKALRLVKLLWPSFIVALILAALVPALFKAGYRWEVCLTVGLSGWLVAIIVLDALVKMKFKASRFTKLSPSFWGMQLAHAGLAVAAIGMALVSIYSQELSLKMAPGERTALGNYQIECVEYTREQGPNYISDVGRFALYAQDKQITVLKAEKRFYQVRKTTLTEAAIHWNLLRDVYVSMGEKLEGDYWAVRLQYKPFMRWVWLGALMMSLGALLALFDKRYRNRPNITHKTNAAREDVKQESRQESKQETQQEELS